MEIREYPPVGERVYEHKLPGGLTVLVVPKRGFYKSCAYFAANYGGADRRFRLDGDWIETPGGIAHFLEHKLFDTATGDAMTKLSVNGASPNAFTSNDMTAYYFTCIDMFPENLRILLDFVSTPYFTPESVQKEQGIITQEILMCDDDPDYCLYYGLMKSLFRSHPQREPVAGSVDSIARITPDMLYDCHKAFYDMENMALCVAGDVDPSEVADIAGEALRDSPPSRGIVPKRDYGPAESLAPESPRFSDEMEISLPIFLAGCKTAPAMPGLDALKLEIIADLALDVLAGHSSPLYFRLYREGLIGADFSPAFDCSAGAACMFFGGESRDPERVFDEVKREIRTIAENGVDKALLERVKKAAIGGNIRMWNSFDAICGNLAESFFKGYDSFLAPEIISGVEDDDISAFLRDRMLPGHMAFSVITPRN